MIHPSIYKYNAPYRGPRSATEISKALTSIRFDIMTANDENKRHGSMIMDNHRHAIGEGDKFHSHKINPVENINGEVVAFKGTGDILSELRSMDSLLDAYLRSL